MTGSRQYDPTATTTAAPSTTEVAKDQASQMAGGAADAAQHVAGVAKEQAGQVASVAGQQVKQLAGKAQSELSDQAQAQQVKLAGGLHSVGDQLKSMAQKSDQQGVATDLAHQVAEKAHEFAGWLDDHSPADLLTEVRSFARRRPGRFLAAALAAGAAAGRFARGLSADPDTTGDTTPPQSKPTPAVGPDVAPPALSSGSPASTWSGPGAFDEFTGRPAGRVRRPDIPAGGYPPNTYSPNNYPQDPAGMYASPAYQPTGGPGSHAVSSAEPQERSLGELIGNITADLSTLMQQEVALAKAEATQSAKRVGKGAGMFAGAGVAGYFVLLFLSIFLWWALGVHIGHGWAALIVAVLWGVVAAVLALRGRKELAQVRGLDRTTETLGKIPNALQGNERQNR